MVNVSHEELAETKSQPLPSNASLDALKQMRESLCSSSMSKDFKLQANQRFLRRVLSPESPTRSLLMVHGTGVGKTCTAIQIAEEYIIRPEFQDKRVLVLANPSVQENFKAQIFDISRVSVDADGLLLSKQCTGRRYLDMIQRSQSESLRYTDKTSQQRVMNLANKIIGEFYEFVGYQTFANMIDRQKLIAKTDNDMKKWIHDTFDNRLIIIDEAHNLKETTESETNKLVAIAIEQILKTAEGVTLVLLTATPMYDTFDEIVYYINLFLWNERKLERTKMIKTSDIFTDAGEFKEGYEKQFRGWCQDYVSFVRGENPFTFPFRLPPPDSMIALPDRTVDIRGQAITKPRKYLTLTKSLVSPLQSAAIKNVTVKAVSDSRLICVYPENKSFRETFEKSEGGYKYRGEKFLAPSKVSLYSSKFGLITKIMDSTTGILFVFSNVVESGAQLFAMCLEEHGFDPALGNRLLKDTSGEVTRGSKGKYVLFTSDISDSEIKKSLIRLKRPENADGSDIRVVIASPKVSEGVDFRNIRQIHVLDPWFNMSRIEQVLGRGMRTCSHSMLPFEEQNCTVYLHVCRYPDSEQETVDEYIYRTFVEDKAIRIAKVKRVVMESAMDCDLQQAANSLPPDWRGEMRPDGSRFLIPQHRNQDPPGTLIELPLSAMSAPTFEEGTYEIKCNIEPSEVDPDHERPLSAILDVKDEILDKVLKLFAKKPVWKNTDLFEHESMKQYTKSVLSYILQNAIDSGFQLKDKQGRIGHLQAKNGVFAFTVGENDTLLDRLLVREQGVAVDLPVHATPEQAAVEAPVVPPVESVGFSNLSAQRQAHTFPEYIRERFTPEVLDWYIADIVLSEKDKIEHLLTLNWSDPPRYARPLLAKTSEGNNLYILGSKNIYNNAKEKTTPIGLEEDAYRAWLKQAKDSFVARKADLFASIKDSGVIFNMDEKSPDVKRAARAKNIGGRQCTTYQAGLLDKFSEWLVGSGFPEKVKTKKDRCLFLDLLVREAVLAGKEGLFWVTPEEYAIFSEDENRSDLLKRLKD
jgi:superfamily II DNA or RNA helicase